MNFIKKLIKKIVLQYNGMKNGWEYLYSKCFRFNRKVPIFMARVIARMNTREILKFGVSKLLFIPTYDGSMQAVHPDIIQWNDEFWLTCTPYPYGVDTYENPSIYHSKDINQWHVPDGCRNPLAFPSIRKRGYHLSDPCLVVFKNSLLLYYRETHKVDGIDRSHISMLSSGNGCNWKGPVTVMKSETDSLISPAIISSRMHCFMFHVRLDNPYGGTLLLSKSDDGINWSSQGEVQVENIPEGMLIWHISIMTKDGYGKVIAEDENICGNLLGLFLMRGINTTDVYKLYWATCEGDGLRWKITEELSIPADLQKYIDLPYKSTVIPKTGDILVSGRGYKHRWYLYLLPKSETLYRKGN